MIRIDIINDGTGDEIVGNYDVNLYLPDDGLPGNVIRVEGATWKVLDAHVEHHTRSNGWDSLVYLAVKALQQQMKGGDTVSTQESTDAQAITIRLNASGDRQQILGQVGTFLKEAGTHGLNMEQVELDGQPVTSDEIMEASQTNEQ